MSDTWDASDDIALSAEINSDKGSDFDRQNDYRLAFVWQVSDEDIVKLMTSTAYRAPAWQELYGMNNPARVGNRNLKPERVRAYEAQYIKKLRQEDSIGANIFYLENKNQISWALNIGEEAFLSITLSRCWCNFLGLRRLFLRLRCFLSDGYCHRFPILRRE